MKIAVLAVANQINSSYRAARPAEALALRGHDVLFETKERDEVRPDWIRTVRGFDALYVYRHHGRAVRELVRQLRDEGTAIVWDNDDDVVAGHMHAAGGNARETLRAQETRSAVARMMSLADIVTTPSHALARIYLREGAADVRVIENHLQRDYGAFARPPHSGVVVGWTAGREHAVDLQRLDLRVTLQRLLGAHPDVRVASIGVDLRLPPERYENIRFLQFHQLGERVAGFDIGLAPICDQPVNRARSNCKLKEYAGVGVPWLASPIGPYEGMGEKQGGRLVPDGEWYAAIERLVVDARLRKRLAKRASRWARDETIDKNAGLWDDAIRAAVARARVRTANRQVSPGPAVTNR